MRNTKKRWFCLVPALYWTPNVLADYKTDIGYTALETLPGISNMPSGSAVNVIQVEAPAGVNELNKPIAAPDTKAPQFNGKTFDASALSVLSATPLSHATGVASLFYGNSSIAYDIYNITNYDVIGWLGTLGAVPVNSSRIANHSWTGIGKTPDDTGNILRLVDRQVARNEYIQVVGMNNGISNRPLLGSAYNVIAVGRTDGGQDRGSDAVDSVYIAGRTRPDIVAPQTTTSSATPIVSAAAALLIETGHSGALNLSNGKTDISGVGTIYNAERSETIKAALMAGADRATDNTSTTANITDYRDGAHATNNGLDDRFGAGQLNILHSYQIIAAGEQDSLQDGGSGLIGEFGFDYDANFGGSAGSNAIASYQFEADTDLNLTASLVWNLGVSSNSGLRTTLHNLDLELFDVTTQTTTAFSSSAIDNTENLWLSLAMGHSYQLLVKSGEADNFSWDYSLAWHMSQTAPIPLPSAAWLFGSVLGGLGFAGRRKA